MPHQDGAPVRLAVSTVIFALRPDGDRAAGALRSRSCAARGTPSRGRWALPGGVAEPAESLADAAARKLVRDHRPARRTTSSSSTPSATLDRSPDGPRRLGRLLGARAEPTRPSRRRGRQRALVPADDLPELAFDHNRIVDYALWRLRTKMEYAGIAHAFLGETFTLAELREVTRSCCSAPRPGELPPHRSRPRAALVDDRRDRPGAPPPPAPPLPLRDQPPSTARPANRSERRGQRSCTPRSSRPEPRHPSTAPSSSSRTGASPARRAAPTSRRGRGSSTPAPGYGPGSSMGDVIPTGSPRQGAAARRVPRRRRTTSWTTRIRAAKATLGDRVVILGHFYQRDEVMQHADFLGDSFQLANAALDRPDAEAIVFCGVHFMAETADISRTPEQAVILPNLAAGCSMADMADIDSVEECWEQLEELYGTEPRCRRPRSRHPGHLHELVGRAQGVLRAARRHRLHLVEREDRARVGVRARPARAVLPRPAPRPQHREGHGRAARADADVEPAQAARRQRRADDLDDARVILWHGFCSVHKRFTVDQIEKARAELPRRAGDRAPRVPDAGRRRRRRGRLDRLHPQGHRRRDRAARRSRSAPRSTWCNRLAAEYPQHTIFCLDPVVCPCSTMYRIHPGYLAWVLEELVAGRVAQPHHRAGRGGRPRPRRPRADARAPSRSTRRTRRSEAGA